MIDYGRIDGMTEEEKAELLHYLLKDLQKRGLISRTSLTAIGGEIARRDYETDEDLTCFSCLEHEMDEA